MSERERWIIYPLLFLALGASLRDKLAKQTRSKQIVCEELFVVDAQGVPVAQLSQGGLVLHGTGGQPTAISVDVVQAKLVQAGTVQADVLVQKGKPVGDVSWNRLLQFFNRFGLMRITPAKPVAPAAPAEPGVQPGVLLEEAPTEPAATEPAATEPREIGPPATEPVAE